MTDLNNCILIFFSLVTPLKNFNLLFMKKVISSKSKALLWILGVILSIVFMCIGHTFRSEYPNLGAFMVIGCGASMVVCVLNAYFKFEEDSLKLKT